MKKLFFLILLTVSSGLFAQGNSETNSQNKSTIDSLQRKIEKLEKFLEDKNYTRVPNNEFDKSLEYIVSQKVSGSILYWIGGLGAILAFAGYSLINSMKNSLKADADKIIKDNSNETSKNLKDLKKELDEEIKIQNEKSVDENKRQDENIKTLNEQVRSNLLALNDYRDDTIKSIDEKFNSALESLWDDIADSKYNRAKELNFTGENLINELKSFLENKTISLSKVKIVALVDALMRCYYSEKKYKEMIELLRKYENNYELLPESYANAAIALNDSYKRSGSEADLKTCIECCDKSIEKLKDYGTAYTVKLEVLMMNYEKAFDDNEKQIVLEKIKRTFKDIENNESPALPYSILERINIDKPISYIKKYIELLEKMFKNDLLNLKQRVCNAILTNENHLKNKTFTDFVVKILQENALVAGELQGSWKVIKSVNSGIETQPSESDSQISFNDFILEQKSSSGVTKADVLFLPYDNITKGFNLYFPDNIEKYVPGIYSLENGILKICLNNDSNVRPEEFISDDINKYSLMTYEKIA